MKAFQTIHPFASSLGISVHEPVARGFAQTVFDPPAGKGLEMTKRVKDFVDINDHVSLDDLINRLVELKATLPGDCEAELRLRGDEVFGRKLSISYFRPLTAEEEECEARYADAEEKRRAA
jgi:hypothetical protein